MAFEFPTINETENMSESHYYQWLKENNVTDIHSINTRKEYLCSLGFVVGTDKVSEENLTLLRYIQNYFFMAEIAPSLKKETFVSYPQNHGAYVATCFLEQNRG